MAGDWIKMRGNLWDDPRVGRICDLCDTSEASVIGGLYWLWATADQHTEDGTMPGLSLRQIDRKTGVPGLAAALVAVGWLLDDPAGVTIIKFEEHNGASAKKRCQTAKRVANFKAGNADETLEQEPGNAPSVSTALPREEKRREEEPPVTPDGVTCDEGSASIAPDGEPDPCPHQAIIAAFHAAFPAARHVRDWTPSRAATLRTRWREKKNRQRVEWWSDFFAYCAKSKFLTGRALVPAGRKPFELSLDWLIKSENFVKAIEGAYHEASDVEETH